MTIWALADLHLAHSVPDKSMAAFGPLWEGYMEKIEANWRKAVGKDDLVLLPGDISWAMRLEEAKIDLEWIDSLPGTKLMIRGNHDYWWASSAKMAQAMPPTLHFIHNTAYAWNDVAIGGTRLWDTEEYRFGQYVHFQENPRASLAEKPSAEETQKIFERELERLKLSLNQLSPSAKKRIAMTHYPPISADLKPSRASQILKSYKIDVCVFGHLHNLDKTKKMFGSAEGIEYILTAADYVDFMPVKIF